MKKGKKIVLFALEAALAVGLLAVGMYLKAIRDYKAQVEALTFTDMDLGNIPDGVYEGRCRTSVVNAGVLVTVQEHAMTEIELTSHDNGRGAPAKVILDRMLREQTTDVDVISGATCSSKVIRKAVENALAKGLPEEER